MFSGRRTGMGALVRRLYIPLGPLTTAPLVPPGYGLALPGPPPTRNGHPPVSFDAPGCGRLQRVGKRKITVTLVTHILSSSLVWPHPPKNNDLERREHRMQVSGGGRSTAGTAPSQLRTIRVVGVGRKGRWVRCGEGYVDRLSGSRMTRWKVDGRGGR